MKTIWRKHFSSALIDGYSEEKIIQSDLMTLRNLNNLVSEWKDLERSEKRTDRPAVFARKLNSCQEKEGEKKHLRQQLFTEQPGAVPGVIKQQ